MIRPALPGDMPAMLRMGKAFHEATPYGRRGLPFSDTDFSESVSNYMDNEDCVVLVAESDGTVVGFAIGLLYPFWFNRSYWCGQELLWWIDPPHRGTLGPKLFREMERHLAERAHFLSVSGTEELRADALEMLYRRKGYEPCDRVFIKRV